MASSAAKADRGGPALPPRDALIGSGDPSTRRVDGKNPGIVAFHGFGGTPREVELVVDVARDLGLAALAPLLPGHGTTARELAGQRWRDFTAAAEQAFDSMPEGPHVVAGLSLGSLLAIHLAAHRPERVRGLILIANATWLAPPTNLGLALWSVLPERFDWAVPKLTSDIADPAARRTHLTYGSQPVRAAIEVFRAGRECRGLLGRVRAPTLILHGARDRVCPVSNAAKVSARLGSVDKRVVIFPRSRHILTRDVERALVRRELLSFVEALR